MEPASAIPDKAARYADQEVDGRRGSDVVRGLVLLHGGWRQAASATGASVGELALTAAGISHPKCEAIRGALPGAEPVPRWRRWARNVRDTALMALFFPVVLGHAGARHRAVPAITLAQALPVLLIAAFFAFGALTKVDLGNVTIGKESFWIFRVGFSTAIAVTGLYAAGFLAGLWAASPGARRSAAIAAAVAIGYASLVPFGNAVADLATEIRETRDAFERNRVDDAALMAKVKADPRYNPLPEQRVMQKALLEATRQDVPGYLASDSAYIAHLKGCFGGGPKSEDPCMPSAERPDRPLAPGALFASLWKRHWTPRP